MSKPISVLVALVSLPILASTWGTGCGDTPADAIHGPNANAGLGEGGAGSSDSLACGADGCPSGLECVHGYCVPPQGPCRTNNDCAYDTYCVDEKCVPYGSLPENRINDPACQQVIAAGTFAPTVKCELVVPPEDPFATYTETFATPMVASFNPGGGGGASIVAVFAAPLEMGYNVTGIIRVLDGATCAIQANIGGIDLDNPAGGPPQDDDFVNAETPVALGDLDGDKVPEIIVKMRDGAIVAFTKKSGTWRPLWTTVRATNADGVSTYRRALASFPAQATHAGLSIHDLDGDGRPEIIDEATVIDGATGRLVTPDPPGYQTYFLGIHPVLANVDADPKIELLNGAAIWEFDPATKTWVPDAAYNAKPSNPGWVALADFDNDGKPEIAVTSDIVIVPAAPTAGGKLTVYTLSHDVFMGMSLDVPGSGGGPPTISDYDGDGLPEIGVAGRGFYTVFDPDCQGTPRPGGTCDRSVPRCDDAAGNPQPCPDRILWSRKTQDISSNVTGSSVFDFEGDGKAEVVYADECFTRIYSGETGKVLFSQYRSSCTWMENPVVVDVDGDFRAELVVPSNTACGTFTDGIPCSGLDANGVDQQFAGLICEKASDCASGVCDQGLCRCTTSAECCAARDDAKCLDFGFKCAPPPAGTPGTGNTCRAAHPRGLHGIRVYEDSADRWVRARSIWNQHAYSITNVNDDGTIPASGSWAPNWSQPGLNNFRQNVPASQSGAAAGDFTAGVSQAACSGGSAILTSPVCNRGAAPVAAGIPVSFYAGTEKVCSGATSKPLEIGECENVTCTWANAPVSAAGAVDVIVVPNDGAPNAECHPDNNKGLVKEVYCNSPR